MPAHQPIIIIADDLSGAAELAGIAFTHGLSAEVHREFEAGDDANVIAIDTDSRHLAPSAAAERLAALTSQILATNPVWIYKKVDSVLRGNVRAEIEAILKVSGHSRALLIPANPSRGRIIRNGQYFINGTPLNQTPFAHDPDHPRRSADVLALLGPGSAESRNISVPDIEGESQLERLATQCDAMALPAGAADFFAALLQHRAPQRARGRESLSQDGFPDAPSAIAKDSRPILAQLHAPALLVCGSLSAWPARRNACLAAGIPICTSNEPMKVSSGSGALLLGIGEMRLESTSENALRILAQCTARLISQLSCKITLAEGGATAAAIAAERNWKRFQVVATAPAGVGVLRPLETNAPLFLIKPGSYPWPAEVWEGFCRCR
jgi:uncharacterized protein YgbK (DUF1537 family)